MDIYFCPFFKFKKEFQKIKIFSVFFQSPKNTFLVFQPTKYGFFGDEIANKQVFHKPKKSKHMHAIFFVSYCVHPISLEAKKNE
jgi:hypothetical protein